MNIQNYIHLQGEKADNSVRNIDICARAVLCDLSTNQHVAVRVYGPSPGQMKVSNEGR
jgi:hypothetical protein